MNNKKLVIVTVSLTSGGLERIVANISNRYISKGWSVTILTLLDPNESIFVQLNEKVVCRHFKDIKGPDASPFSKLLTTKKWIKFIKNNLQEIKPDCVLAMTIKIGSMVVIANKKIGARVVVREISDPKSKVRNQMMNKVCFHFCKRANGFIFQTEWEKSCFPKKIQRIGKVIPNPVVLKMKANSPKRNVVVTMGRLLNLQKRHDVLINSFAVFLNKHPDFSLEIYGEGPDLSDDIKLVKKLKIEDAVIFKGACKNVHELISDASCFAITSDFEGLSNALLEAYLMGIPCITSDWPGASEVITDGYDGFVVKRDDINGFAKAIAEIVDNKELANKFSSRSQKNLEKYNPDLVFKQYEDIIEGVQNE